MVRIQPPASFAGFKSVTVKSNERGEVDIDDLKRVVNEKYSYYVVIQTL